MLESGETNRQIDGLFCGHQSSDSVRGVTESCSHVRRPADVVLAFEEHRVAGGDSNAEREGSARNRGVALEFHRERDSVVCLHSYCHQSVAEILVDAHALM